MPPSRTGCLGVFSLLAVLLFYLASSDIARNLSPQGCRMSWMSPSYVLQTQFDLSWSPLARRYSLWLYREVGWDSVQEAGQRKDSIPVLFIPGNAGSSHQVRSIASSASRQYFSSPYVVSPAFESRTLKPLDFFAVEFNEDLSAFHGSTLESQISYTSKAITFIMSLYPPRTQVIVLGHSMGGIVATSLLPSPNISAIITMSTPHTLPPARFDSRIDAIYGRLQHALRVDTTPIVSICGGATDMMIPSESCILPPTVGDAFRTTVFTSALEGAWTGVGHREMVWCHQVRWRVARAALELSGAEGVQQRATILNKWLRDGHSLPPIPFNGTDDDIFLSGVPAHEVLPDNTRLVLKPPQLSKLYLLPVAPRPYGSAPQQVTLLVSQGSIHSVAPQNHIPLRVSVYVCASTSASENDGICKVLKPSKLKLIPAPIPGSVFPLPDEGSDESDGVVAYEAHVDASSTASQQWIGIEVENADGRGWIVAGLNNNRTEVNEVSTFSLLMGSVAVPIPVNDALSVSFSFPNLLSSALLAYRLTPPRHLMPACTGSILPPLIMYTSHPAETHYYPIVGNSSHQILLHSHLSAPFIDQATHDVPMLKYTLYSSGEVECKRQFPGPHLTIDWSASLARWASRYLNTLVSWAVGVVAFILLLAWGREDHGSPIPNPSTALRDYNRVMLHYLLPASFLVSFLPLPEYLYLGNQGNGLFAPLAPLLLLISSGLVCVSWWMLSLLVWTFANFGRFLLGSRRAKNGVLKTTIASLLLICLLVFLFVPWQVAYLGCWLLHLYTCASTTRDLIVLSDPKAEEIALTQVTIHAASVKGGVSGNIPIQRLPSLRSIKENNLNHNLLLLLLMTWLLPFAAPVLAAWVRTLLTAGFTTSFDGDHNFLAVLPFLVLTDFASWAPGQLFELSRFEGHLSLRWMFAAIAGVSFVFGSRKPYIVFDGVRAAIWVIVICRIGRRYLGLNGSNGER